MRRLKESTMLETEIGKTGEVVVEGHVIGRLDGFVFAAAPTAGGSEAKALQATAQKALAGEIDARAARLSQAPDEQFVLASDGAIRWQGAPVGKLTAAEEVLRPRVRIIADEQLTGASRDLVQARLDLWVKAHVEKVLGSLFTLSAAEDVTGMARGIAFQLVEALGVLERQKVADDVKGLDQPARATLRKYGVRFGAYHIYLPNLLKPAPRMLAAQLWALKHAAPDTKGLDDLRTLAASGRTSIPTDKEIPRPLYRTVGYRVCGERAVRVDILERLADLIRPALGWREGSPIPKPPGAAEGGFTVTPAMTSLTGASGEDFASVLRALGYRMERKPKPTEAPTAPSAEPVAAVPEAGEGLENQPGPSGENAPSLEAAPVPEPELVPATEAPPTEPAAPEESPAEQAAPATGIADADEVSAAVAETAPTSETPADPAPAVEEPAYIEVWRPGRSPDRPRHAKPRRQRRPEKAAQSVPSVAPDQAQGVAAEGAEVPQQQQRRKPRPERHRPDKRQGGGHPRHGRPERERGPRRDRDRDRGSFKQRPPERREKVADPNSPFAKLAALKAQLEADSKERS
jgi:ATP-dependent RNA helicase SUPV3L1/SUV3